jgi:hypothetical protein
MRGYRENQRGLRRWNLQVHRRGGVWWSRSHIWELVQHFYDEYMVTLLSTYIDQQPLLGSAREETLYLKRARGLRCPYRR